jgi:GMP synthase-like glutamine amidotransferase
MEKQQRTTPKISSKLPLRIAILECDTPLEKTKAKYGGYGGVFKQMLERSADTLQCPGLSSKHGLELTYFKVEQHPELYPCLNNIDAILITGSRKPQPLSLLAGQSLTQTIGYDSFAPSPWIIRLVEYVKQVLDQDRVRVIGVCFGHQIVARALGQHVNRGEAGWEVSVTPVELSELGKQLFKQDTLVC